MPLTRGRHATPPAARRSHMPATEARQPCGPSPPLPAPPRHPPACAQRGFAQRHMPQYPLFRLASLLYEVVPGILMQTGKVLPSGRLMRGRGRGAVLGSSPGSRRRGGWALVRRGSFSPTSWARLCYYPLPLDTDRSRTRGPTWTLTAACCCRWAPGRRQRCCGAGGAERPRVVGLPGRLRAGPAPLAAASRSQPAPRKLPPLPCCRRSTMASQRSATTQCCLASAARWAC